MDVVRENVEQAIARERLLPQIGRAVIAVGSGGIARAVLVPEVEGQPLRVLAFEPRCHEHEGRD